MNHDEYIALADAIHDVLGPICTTAEDESERVLCCEIADKVVAAGYARHQEAS